MRSLAAFILITSACYVSCRGIGGDKNSEQGDQTVQANDGGWVSSGGGYFKDSGNPWFLQNTTEATYCIVQDDQNFDVNVDVIRSKIQKSFDYWKTYFEFVGEGELRGPGHKIKIATQNFREVPCSSEVDIRFQFGVLSEPQAKYLINSKNFVSVNVRTYYDQANLHGKGFIYISPLKGPLALEHVLNDGIWADKDSVVLEAALTHELGHLFGVPHIGSDTFSLMHERFLDQMMQTPSLARWALRDPRIQRFCGLKAIASGQVHDGTLNIPLESDVDCLEIKGNLITSSVSDGGSAKELGHFEPKDGHGIPFDQPFIKLTLNDVQTIFPTRINKRGTEVIYGKDYDIYNYYSALVLTGDFSTVSSQQKKSASLRYNFLSTDFEYTDPDKQGNRFYFTIPLSLPLPVDKR